MHVNESFILAGAIRTAAEQLSSMPRSMNVRALRMVMLAIEEEVADWSRRPPSRDEHHTMMGRVLAIQLAMPKLVPRSRHPSP